MLRAQGSHQLEPAVGHVDVAEHGIHLGPLGDSQRFLTRPRQRDLKTVPREPGFQHHPDGALVIDHQNMSHPTHSIPPVPHVKRKNLIPPQPC
jgi:hypothetical protein